MLDPLVTSGRQVKSDLKLDEWVPNIVNAALPAFQTDDVEVRIVHHLSKNSDGFEVRVVPGMVVQVVSNLLDNARYWVKRKRIVGGDEHYAPEVLIEIDEVEREIRISDNGPGVEPSMRNTIFDAFVSTKPTADGVGLGLFISREIAAYSNATLVLLEGDGLVQDMTTTFALRFPKGGQ